MSEERTDLIRSLEWNVPKYGVRAISEGQMEQIGRLLPEVAGLISQVRLMERQIELILVGLGRDE